MVKIKICGITALDDALHALDCGADALGFVFYERSPRAITRQRAQAIIATLPPFVTVVGLFVNADPGIVRAIADDCGLDVIQYHGDESPETLHLAPRRAIRALRVRESDTLDEIDRYPASGLLLDAWVAGAFGGTGVLCNWEIAAEIAKKRPVILAGGLTLTPLRYALWPTHSWSAAATRLRPSTNAARVSKVSLHTITCNT
jgi:phosphoribosylanthranilate isomerase